MKGNAQTPFPVKEAAFVQRRVVRSAKPRRKEELCVQG